MALSIVLDAECHPPADDTMSPELLGWHEQHGITPEHGLVGASGPLSPESESGEHPPSFHFTRLPATATNSKLLAAGSALGKASRVRTPARWASSCTSATSELCIKPNVILCMSHA